MSGMFWNGRGINDESRVNFFRHEISSKDLHFIGIQETKKSCFSDSWLNRISGRQNFC